MFTVAAGALGAAATGFVVTGFAAGIDATFCAGSGFG
jgi:hypothetical protein